MRSVECRMGRSRGGAAWDRGNASQKCILALVAALTSLTIPPTHKPRVETKDGLAISRVALAAATAGCAWQLQLAETTIGHERSAHG